MPLRLLDDLDDDVLLEIMRHLQDDPTDPTQFMRPFWDPTPHPQSNDQSQQAARAFSGTCRRLRGLTAERVSRIHAQVTSYRQLCRWAVELPPDVLTRVSALTIDFKADEASDHLSPFFKFSQIILLVSSLPNLQTLVMRKLPFCTHSTGAFQPPDSLEVLAHRSFTCFSTVKTLVIDVPCTWCTHRMSSMVIRNCPSLQSLKLSTEPFLAFPWPGHRGPRAEILQTTLNSLCHRDLCHLVLKLQEDWDVLSTIEKLSQTCPKLIDLSITSFDRYGSLAIQPLLHDLGGKGRQGWQVCVETREGTRFTDPEKLWESLGRTKELRRLDLGAKASAAYAATERSVRREASLTLAKACPSLHGGWWWSGYGLGKWRYDVVRRGAGEGEIEVVEDDEKTTASRADLQD